MRINFDQGRLGSALIATGLLGAIGAVMAGIPGGVTFGFFGFCLMMTHNPIRFRLVYTLSLIAIGTSVILVATGLDIPFQFRLALGMLSVTIVDLATALIFFTWDKRR